MAKKIDDSPEGLAILLDKKHGGDDGPDDDGAPPDVEIPPGLEDAMEDLGIGRDKAKAFMDAVTCCMGNPYPEKS
jgi:hypothetical protein